MFPSVAILKLRLGIDICQPSWTIGRLFQRITICEKVAHTWTRRLATISPEKANHLSRNVATIIIIIIIIIIQEKINVAFSPK